MAGDSALRTSSPELGSDKKLSTAIEVCLFADCDRTGDLRGGEGREAGAALVDFGVFAPTLIVPPFLNAAIS